MTTLEFSLRQFDGAMWPVGVRPRLWLRPSGPGVDAWGAHGGGDIPVTVEGLQASVEVTPTVAMQGDVYYTLLAEWLAGGIVHREWWPHKIRIPERDVVDLFEVVDVRPDVLHQLIEVSEGTEWDGRPVPHAEATDIWIRITGTGAELWLPEEEDS